MTMKDPDPADDPWLTLVEIAEELRVNPATVRLWISRGRLKAMRAGQRKLLVRRSELDRMLALTDPSRTAPHQPRITQPLRPVFSRPLAGQVARARANMDPAVIRDAIQTMQEAEAVFETAVEESDNAPPDHGFSQRLRAIADASLQRGEALERASLIPGFTWTPASDPVAVIRSHELRPGANRPGLAHDWRHYDMAVERLSIAVQGNVLSLVAIEFQQIGWVLNKIADTLEQNTSTTNPVQPPELDPLTDPPRQQG